MNTFLICWAITAVIAMLLFIKELIDIGEVKIYHLLLLPIAALFSPLVILDYLIDHNVLNFTIWKRK